MEHLEIDNRLLKKAKKGLEPYGIYFDIVSITSPSHASKDVYIRACITFYLRSNGYTFWDIATALNRTHASIINYLKYDTYKSGVYRKKYTDFKDMVLNKSEQQIVESNIEYHKNELIKAQDRLKEIIIRNEYQNA